MTVPLPCGFEFPELDERAIDDLREYHFPGGGMTDCTKGLFRSDLTNDQLEHLFQKGLETQMAGPNANDYYERVFDSGIVNIGVTSAQQGARAASRPILQ
ncbi:hypothetical protein ACGFR8_23020 [Streptomyces brevispora]|uniref:hypothetical protein n=1 Tax=Streptomyces brevispora TaxID=887462 RepID=UPI00371C1473